MIYFGSDWHVGHNKILSFCDRRPIESLDEMREYFLNFTLATLKEGDELWLLGDICFTGTKDFLNELSKAKGKLHLVKGNHDRSEVRNHKIWEGVYDYHELEGIHTLPVILMHYPIESWRKQKHGSLHLHGHTHNNLSHDTHPIDNRWDVGYDSIKQPFASLSEIQTKHYLNKVLNEDSTI